MMAKLGDAFRASNCPRWRRILTTVVSLGVAAALWLPCVHLLFTPRLGRVPSKARALAARHLALWTNPSLREAELAKMRGSNAEWDFMGRTFLVLALSNMALREPASKPELLRAMDAVIDDTLRLEREKGMYYFLMPYARRGEFVAKPPRSLFIDGEIALMLGARRMVEEKPEYKPLLAERVGVMLDYMQRSPVLCAESYPDECWTFDNTTALAAIRMADVLDGTDHSAFIRRWLETAKKELVDGKTGLLVSNCTVRGSPMEGPEGSTLWVTAHNLLLFDEDFAREQYERARRELRVRVLGFSFAREWPRSWTGHEDIDSGPVVPILRASPASSGLAMVGASAFGDREFFSELLASLELLAFPVKKDGGLKYCASNQVGDAVLLYAMTYGPLWKRLKGRSGSG